MGRKIYILVMIVILFSGRIYSQRKELQIQGEPRKIDSELVGVRDINGNYCAALKIISPLKGLSYKSYNGVIKVDREPGQDLVFVTADERVLEVYHTSHAPTKIILFEQGIRLREKEVWEMTLISDRKTPVYIITEPEGAEIYLNGEKVAENNVLQATLGNHRLTIKKDGYRTIEEEINVTDSMAPLKYQLKEIQLAQVEIITQPTGADILINGVQKGQSDKGLWLFPDTYFIELKLSGYASLQDTLRVRENEINQFKFVFNKSKNFGLLNVVTEPADALLHINKDIYKNTKNIHLGAGNYQIEVVKPGYGKISEWIKINQNETLNKHYELKRLTGDLRFNITPLTARVKMVRDETLIEEWSGMKQLSGLPTGQYRFYCENKNFEDLVKEGTIEENKILNLNIEMKKSKSLPLFSWIKEHKVASALIGAGVTAGGIAIYSMFQEDDSKALPGIDEIWPPR